MKTLFEQRSAKLFAALCGALLLLAALAAILPLPAQVIDSQGLSSAIYQPTNVAAVVNAASGTNVSSVITLHKGQGLALQWTYSGSTNVQLILQASDDGTNYSTFNTWVNTNLTGTVTLLTNWQPAQLAGFYAFKVLNITNTGTIPLTNNALIVNRPN